MTILSLIVLVIIFGIPVGFALQPLFAPKLDMISEDQNTFEANERKKQVLYQQIKELELEYGLGLIPEDEYSAMRQELKQHVANIMTELNPKK
ncbi:MAG: hypothetical protein HOD97_00130 [Candidatus Marinimicrobia bacterium]|nr:hypothetical protein [Candidatus Neomarinimicrobiota bacterium]MBT3618426.1 hypothetical protein [Candidatus Neomarinimicrobiota bacterium]MBT3829018.1 hypothetical protein [Candidatus Neomarinimicrobiota bacterium]MBT3997939.1 hypothetical protein [Candidatus Neomarinimicrobiota bacterium]MBT4280021.1 hypothetical protein [Candidatus Neomarinimicrobiota bacterium]